MKLKPLILAAAAALTLSSCNMEGTSEATPRIGVAAINLATQDTLGFTGNRLDTVCVGDTIQFQSIVDGMYNGLLEYHIVSSDTAHVEFLWGSENKLDSIFNSHDGGSFYMDGQYSQLFFPFKYIIKDSINDLSITFSALTDASAEYSQASLRIFTPARNNR